MLVGTCTRIEPMTVGRWNVPITAMTPETPPPCCLAGSSWLFLTQAECPRGSRWRRTKTWNNMVGDACTCAFAGGAYGGQQLLPELGRLFRNNNFLKGDLLNTEHLFCPSQQVKSYKTRGRVQGRAKLFERTCQSSSDRSDHYRQRSPAVVFIPSLDSPKILFVKSRRKVLMKLAELPTPVPAR